MAKQVKEYSLRDYNRLAYEFAIRNPRVIELLNSTLLTDGVADELLNTYGINIKVERYDSETGDYLGIENTLKELCLDYPHLKELKGIEYIHFRNPRMCELCKKITQQKKCYEELESGDKAIKRIQELIEARGGKLKRLMKGSPFTYYDKVTFENKSKYSLDPSTNKKNTIETDIEFIKNWIEPSKYLQLIPKYDSFPII